jgi:hypothetical protein
MGLGVLFDHQDLRPLRSIRLCGASSEISGHRTARVDCPLPVYLKLVLDIAEQGSKLKCLDAGLLVFGELSIRRTTEELRPATCRVNLRLLRARAFLFVLGVGVGDSSISTWLVYVPLLKFSAQVLGS